MAVVLQEAIIFSGVRDRIGHSDREHFTGFRQLHQQSAVVYT
jgi:hypothetical protein